MGVERVPAMHSLIKLIQYFGLHKNPSRKNILLKVTLHTMFVLVMVMTIVPQVALLFQSGYTLFEKIEAVTIIVPMSKALLKLSHRVLYLHKFWEFYDDVQVLYDDNARQSPEKAMKIQSKISAEEKFYIKIYLSCYWTVFILFNIAPLVLAGIFEILGKPAQLKHPFVGEYFVDSTKNPAFAVIYFAQASAGMITVYGAIIDIICMTCCIYVNGQIRILNMYITESSGDANMDQIDGGEVQANGTELKKYVQLHVAVIKLVKKLDSLFSVHFGLECLNVAAMSCLALFQVTCVTSLSSKISYMALAALGYASIYMQIRQGQKMIEGLELLETAVYALPWTTNGARYSRVVAIMLQAAQRPLRLTGFKVYSISAETFLAVLKTGYSFFAVLQTAVIEPIDTE